MSSFPAPFDTLDTDPDTTILGRKLITLHDRPVLHETWRWDGLIGESLVFTLADVHQVSDETLVAWAREAGVLAEGETPEVKRSENGFAFLSFGFRN